MPYRIPQALLEQTFREVRTCGGGERECQVLWLSPWRDIDPISEVVHSEHVASGAGFRVDEGWVAELWSDLAQRGLGVRVQVHTHPGRAFHSHTDDEWPLIRSPGFLSLVLPGFGTHDPGFRGAYLAEIDDGGHWRAADIESHLTIVS